MIPDGNYPLCRVVTCSMRDHTTLSCSAQVLCHGPAYKQQTCCTAYDEVITAALCNGVKCMLHGNTQRTRQLLQH